MKIRSLRLATFLITLSILLLSLGAVYFLLWSMVKKSAENMAEMTAKGISRQVFSSMYQVMSRGWKRSDVIEFLRALEVSYTDTPLSVNIYRGDKVVKLFGIVPEPQRDDVIKKAFKLKLPASQVKGSIYRYAEPVTARSECLRCHVNAREGDVLGVVETKIDMSSMFSKIRNTFFISSLFIIPLGIGTSVWVSLLFMRSIRRIKENVESSVESIKRVEDIEKLAEAEIPYKEFEELNSSLKGLAERIREIAIDRDILELEINILERFIITHQFIKDWKEYISSLLVDINKVTDVKLVFSIFIEDSYINTEVFWLKRPDDELRRAFEKSLEEQVMNKVPISVVGNRTLNINHNVALEGESFNGFEEEKLKMKTKTLVLDKPHLGGIVGVGITTDLALDRHRQPVIDTVLATLVNVIGSTKAISSYIKDIEFYAMRDPLTFLYNQRTFWELLNYEIERANRFGRKLSLIMMDLDNFKVINDTYGHMIGDKIIREVARVISENKRSADVASRYGGDEFIVIAIGADSEQAYHLARRIKKAVESISVHIEGDKTIVPEISIGISTYPDHAKSPRDLFLIADNMLRRAKEEGRSRVRLPTAEDLTLSRGELTEKSLIVLDALSKKIINPFFQPIVDLKTGEVFANEVLMRVGEKNVPAGEFVEVAENLGVITRMDMILYEEVFKKVQEEGYSKKLFLNLSARILTVEEFVNRIKRLIEGYGIEPENIVFELTERESIKNLELLESFVRSLKDIGVSFAIDDFGSGYSSFHYLKKVPVDFVKIEGEFVQGAVTDWKDRTFIESIVTLTRGMRIKTVAEFIEDEQTLRVMKECGVDYGQGFFFGRPSTELRF